MKELLIVLVIVLIIFGSKRLVDIAKDLGVALRDFRKSVDGGEPCAIPENIEERK